MDLTPYYVDARNAITQPDRMVFVSQYFRRRWMPALGPLGTAVVIYLRGACYHNRRSGETRDTVQVSQREIALGCGCSVPTIKRELERNEALRRFVQVIPEWERNAASGRVRQLENHYKVAMDDPLTEADEALLQEMAAERAAQERKEPPGGARRRNIRIGAQEKAGDIGNSTAGLASVRDQGIDAVNTAISNAVNSGVNQLRVPGDQIELLRPGDQIEPTPVQIELLSEESLLKTTNEQTLNVRETVNFVTDAERMSSPIHSGGLRNVLEEGRDAEAASIVEELRDWGSERRHKQLLAICEQHGLSSLSGQALHATRQRLAHEQKRGLLEKPGAYYQSVLISLLEGHQIFVPKAGEDNPDEVRQLARRSLGLED